MATQYTAGLTTGQVLTSATMNSIGAAWETWNPNIRAGGGTGTMTLVRARYARIQKLIFFRIEATVNAIGTSAGQNLAFDFPITASTYSNGGSVGFGRETILIGYGLNVMATSTAGGVIQRYDGAGFLAAGQGYALAGLYEAA